MDPLDPACATTVQPIIPSGSTYISALVSSDPIGYSLFNFNVNVPSLAEPEGITTMTFNVTLSVSPFYSVERLFDIEVLPCLVTGFSTPLATDTTQFYLRGFPAVTLVISIFTQVPACMEPLTLTATHTSSFFTVSYSPSLSIQVEGSDLSLAGDMTVVVRATADDSFLASAGDPTTYFDHVIIVTLVDCTPNGFIATPPQLATSQLGPFVYNSMSKNPPHANCGTYTYQLDPGAPSFATLSANMIFIAPTLDHKPGDYTI